MADYGSGSSFLSGYRVLKCEALLRAPHKELATALLIRIAAQVEPIMRARRWTVKLFKEMCPKSQGLLGMNVNRGSKILIRLRNGNDNSSNFKPYEELLDTMLHELCHMEIGPHSAQFYKLWDELRQDCDKLIAKNITGSNDMLLPAFSGNGHRLGGRTSQTNSLSVRQLTREAAEKRLKLYSKPQSTSSSNSKHSAILTRDQLRERVRRAAEMRRQAICEKGGCRNIVEGVDLIELDDNDVEDRQKQNQNSQNNTNNGKTGQIKKATLENNKKDQIQIESNSNLKANDSMVLHQGTLKQSKINGSENAKSKSVWVCVLCTLFNDVSRMQCTACGTPRDMKNKRTFQLFESPAEVPKASKEVGTTHEVDKWSCRACTYINSSSTSQCEICNNEKTPTIIEIV